MHAKEKVSYTNAKDTGLQSGGGRGGVEFVSKANKKNREAVDSSTPWLTN